MAHLHGNTTRKGDCLVLYLFPLKVSPPRAAFPGEDPVIARAQKKRLINSRGRPSQPRVSTRPQSSRNICSGRICNLHNAARLIRRARQRRLDAADKPRRNYSKAPAPLASVSPAALQSQIKVRPRHLYVIASPSHSLH